MDPDACTAARRMGDERSSKCGRIFRPKNVQFAIRLAIMPHSGPKQGAAEQEVWTSYIIIHNFIQPVNQ